jgi:DNA polymerase-3 subunit alpha
MRPRARDQAHHRVRALRRPKSRHTKTKEDGAKYYHLTVLARNETGYRNLVKLTSLGYLEGFYYKPRVDKELLRRYSQG